MRRSLFTLCSVLLLPLFSEAIDFEKHPWFSRVVGEWTGAGEMTNAEGEVSKMTEKWEGKVDPAGSFVINGTREWNGETFEFRWAYHYNPTTELFEVDYWQTGMEGENLKLEASITDDQVQMKAPFGDSGAELRVVNIFVDGNIESKVDITDSQGQAQLSGEVIHSKPS